VIGDEATTAFGSDQVGSRRPWIVRSHALASSSTSAGVAPRANASVQ
jgi:hypothetical protein